MATVQHPEPTADNLAVDKQGRSPSRPRLRLVRSTDPVPLPVPKPRRKRPAIRRRTDDEAGTTTAEYTVVTAAAVAFGALLLKLLTGGWGERILATAFREVITMLGF